MSTFPGFDRPLNQYKVSELKVFLRDRSLKVGGLKKVLIKRLTEALKKEQEALDDANESDDESVIEEDPPQSTKDEQTDTNHINPPNHDNTSDLNQTNNDKKENETEINHSNGHQNKKDNNNDKNDKNDQKDENNKNALQITPSAPKETQTETKKNEKEENENNKQKEESASKQTETTKIKEKEGNDVKNETPKEEEKEKAPKQTETAGKQEAEPVEKEDNQALESVAKGRDSNKGKPSENAPSTDSFIPSVNTNNNKETTNHDNVDKDNKQHQKAPEAIMEDKEPSPTASDTSAQSTEPVHNTEKEQEARDQKLAAMRARLLRDKLLKQQKSNSSSAHSSPIVTSPNTKKRSVRDFEEDNQSHKRRKLNEKNLEITDSKRVGGRIVVEMNENHEINRKLYVPPHQRPEEEGLNDNSHEIEFDDGDNISGSALFIDGFRRPLQTKKVEQELIKYGVVKSFRMNAIKSHCYVVFDSNESAAKCKESMDDMHFPPNIPQIHAGKLKVKTVRMVEAMKFIQSEEQRGRRLKRSFETKQIHRSFETKQAQRSFDITVETRDGKKEKESKTPKELFEMTSCTPYIFWMEADEEKRKKNEEALQVLIDEEKERYRVWKERKKTENVSVSSPKEREDTEDREDKDDGKHRNDREHTNNRDHREHREHRDNRHRVSPYMRGRNNGYFRERMRNKRGNMRYYGARRGRRDYREHHRDDRRDRRVRERRDRSRDRRYRDRMRDRRNRRKFDESESESDDESESERSRSRSRSSGSRSSMSSSSSHSKRGKRDSDEDVDDYQSKRGRKGRDNIPTTTTTSTLSSTKEASTEFVHPERMNRIS